MRSFRLPSTFAVIFVIFVTASLGSAWTVHVDYDEMEDKLPVGSDGSSSNNNNNNNNNGNEIEVEGGEMRTNTRQLLFPRFPEKVDNQLEANGREKIIRAYPSADEIVQRVLAWSNQQLKSQGHRLHLNISTFLSLNGRHRKRVIADEKDIRDEEDEGEIIDDFDYEESLEEKEIKNTKSDEELLLQISRNTVHIKSMDCDDQNDKSQTATVSSEDNDSSDSSDSSSSSSDENTSSTSKFTSSNLKDGGSSISDSMNANVEVAHNNPDLGSKHNPEDEDYILSETDQEDIIELGMKLFQFGEHTEETVRSFFEESLNFVYGEDEEVDEFDMEHDMMKIGWPKVSEVLTPSTNEDIEQMFTESPASLPIEIENDHQAVFPDQATISSTRSGLNEDKVIEEKEVVSVIFYRDTKVEIKAVAVGVIVTLAFCGLVMIIWKFSKKHKEMLEKEKMSAVDGKILV